MNRVLIFTGGRLGEWALRFIREDDYIIGADRGAAWLVRHGLRPDLSIGDFDSVSDGELAEIRLASKQFEACDPVLKDYSDTELAFLKATERGADEILLIGALGTRFDHTLANVHLLVKAEQFGIACRLLDEHNEIQLTSSKLEIANPGGNYTYVSLLPLTAEVTGVTLEGFQYPLNDALLTMGQSLAVSNRLTAPTGIVRIRSGLLLVIQSKD